MKKTTTILTAAFALTMVSARAQLVLDSINTPVTEDFQSFTGTGFSPTPSPGQLDSDTWIVTGIDEGDLAFGDTGTATGYAQGSSNGGVSGGGVYAFDVGSGNIVLGVQPTGADFTAGEFGLALLNDTGVEINELDVSYNVWILNNGTRGNTITFGHTSLASLNGTLVGSTEVTSPTPADPSPTWSSTTVDFSITGLSIAPGENYYLYFRGDDFDGSGARDEFGIDTLSVTAVPEPGSIVMVALTALAAVGIIRFRKKA